MSVQAVSSASTHGKRSASAGSRAELALRVLTLVTAALMMLELYLVFVHAPIEKQMGIVYKVLFFHAPSAYAMYIGFGVSALASAVYLAKRDERWDAWAVAGAEVGAAFCLIMLTTGPLWGKIADAAAPANQTVPSWAQPTGGAEVSARGDISI